LPRPRRRRWVGHEPGVTFFKPRGVPMNQLEEITISIEEYEALKLADLQGKSQKDSAERMGVSQPTFNRLLSAARKKISNAIVNGKAIKIEGGHYVITSQRGD
jgi:predicted DNA-binding protein (UPF0251 family)